MQLPGPPGSGWNRWPQNESENDNQDYMMMGPTMLATSGPLQRPITSPRFVVNQLLTGPPTMHPMPSMGPPLFQPFGFMSYSNQSPSQPVPLRVATGDPDPAPNLKMEHETSTNIMRASPQGSPLVGDQDDRGSFSSLSSLSSSSSSATATPSKVAGKMRKVITNVAAEDAASVGNHVAFHTPMDEFMRVIQAIAVTKDEDAAVDVKMEAPSPSSRLPQDTEDLRENEKTRRAIRRAGLKHQCEFRGCKMRFSQRTHLNTHRRSHTGERPYACEWDGCTKRFTQCGNLKAHMRRHNGERPYECNLCGKRFSARGNMNAHLKTHQGKKEFICKLEDCHKKFTQRGNLKYHQNKFHMGYVQKQMARFAAVKSFDDLSDSDQKLCLYLAQLFENTNKGIKGRGVGCSYSRFDKENDRSSAGRESSMNMSGLSSVNSISNTSNMGNMGNISSRASSNSSYSPVSSIASYSMPSPNSSISSHVNSPVLASNQLSSHNFGQQQLINNLHQLCHQHQPTSYHHSHQSGLAHPAVSYSGGMRNTLGPVATHNHFHQQQGGGSSYGMEETMRGYHITSSASSHTSSPYGEGLNHHDHHDHHNHHDHHDHHDHHELAFGDRIC